jgi:phosphatidylglycerol lysyltransferase
MGYFTDDYMQQCRIWAAYDDAGQLQGFLNLLPSDDFDNVEATYDFLRQRQSSLPNTNDFLLTSLLEWLPTQGYQRLNLGLSPLAGLAGDRDADTVIDNILKLAYQNGDRFYSFSGLHRFKDKYEPAWSDRYVAYRGSLASYVRVMRALLQAMKKI